MQIHFFDATKRLTRQTRRVQVVRLHRQLPTVRRQQQCPSGGARPALLEILFETQKANCVVIENVSLLFLRQKWGFFNRFDAFSDLLRPAHLI